MEIMLSTIMSREFTELHKDVLFIFKEFLSKGFLEFKSSVIEEMSVRFVCVSPMFCRFYKLIRPKFYEEKIIKTPHLMTPEVRWHKHLIFDFFMDFETYFHAKDKQECFRVLGISFIKVLETLKYPSKVKKFEKEKFLQFVKDVLVANSIISAEDVE
ncbi:MAG: hypothetical protein ACI3YX_01560 [Prevotella sp.]